MLVSVIVPTRNEARAIAACLESLSRQDYPKDRLEILVVDGMSEDGTRDIVRGFARRWGCIRLLDNERRFAPHAFNIGIRNSRGAAVAIVSAHAAYPDDYISKCVENLARHDAQDVGGLMATLPGAQTRWAQAIALALSHRFGVGNALFRTGSDKAISVDTVPFGCYRREVFDRIGYFNENLIRNLDIEFNLRLKRSGGKIMLVPDIHCSYFARPTLSGFARQAFANGYWVLYGMRFAPLPFSWRHLVPFFFVGALALGAAAARLTPVPLLLAAGAYALAAAAASAALAARNGLRHFPFLCAAFPVLHISYGLGSAAGALHLLAGWARAAAAPRLGGPCKRAFDFSCALAGLVLAAPLLAAAALAVRATSRGPALFAQDRVGLDGVLFRIYKFRTMTRGAERLGTSVTAAGDARVTALGRFLRRTKTDELPQLINVLKGDMSLVGPRPDVPEIVAKYTPEMRRILAIRPGITSLATLHLRDEESLLALARAPDRFYDEVLVPLKVEIAMEHVRRRSFLYDLEVLVLTVWMLSPLGRLWPVREDPRVRGLRQRLSHGEYNAHG